MKILRKNAGRKRTTEFKEQHLKMAPRISYVLPRRSRYILGTAGNYDAYTVMSYDMDTNLRRM